MLGPAALLVNLLSLKADKNVLTVSNKQKNV
jgi:hypothetical protein